MFQNKTIIVYGGSGTIGSLIVEYLRNQSPHAIRVFTNDENSLWEAKQKWGTNNEMRYFLGDIKDYERVLDSMTKVDYVFNAAAIKHVPFAEENPLEAVKTNIIGLYNIIQAGLVHKVEKILHISTDKAVESTSVMGATKMIGEKLLQVRWSQNPEVEMVCVRLGNVWDSRGSIVPLIHECERLQKPIPLTSPDMTRYFMSPEEVIEFITLAFRLGGDGEIYIPKLKVVRILDVIQGQVGIDYPCEIIGIRQGEKLTEKLITEEEFSYCIEKEKYWILPNKIPRENKNDSL